MKFFSAEEMAKVWGISSRRVTLLAKEGRIIGAQKISQRWMIPENAKKPIDGRTNAGKQNKETDFFRLPLYINFDESTYYPPLSKEEALLRKAQLEFYACNFENANKLLLPLAKSAQNTYVRISALFHLCFSLIPTKKYNDFKEYQYLLDLLLLKKDTHMREIMLIKYMFAAIYGTPKEIIEDFEVDYDYEYETYSYGLLSCLSIFTTISKDVNNISKIRLDSFEAICKQLEYEGLYFEAQFLHVQLMFGYQMQLNKDAEVYHMKKLLQIAKDKSLFYLAAINITYAPDAFTIASSEFPKEFIKTIKHHAEICHVTYVDFTKVIGKPSFYSVLTKTEYKYVYFATQGYSNKEIANLLDTTVHYVSKKYSDIYHKLNVKSRKELVDLITNYEM